MIVKIKSPEVARRLRGMGGYAYEIDSGKDTSELISNARHFSPRGYDFDALCRSGRISIRMRDSGMLGWLGGRSHQENRRLVAREIERQRSKTQRPKTRSIAPGATLDFSKIDEVTPAMLGDLLVRIENAKVELDEAFKVVEKENKIETEATQSLIPADEAPVDVWWPFIPSDS